MGFSYRKSLRAGPFRITASKSGISYSAGVKGARITKRANGKVQTTLSVPRTGLRYTSTSGARTRPATRPAATRASTPTRRTATAAQPRPRPRTPAPPRPRRLPGQIDRTHAGRVNGNHSTAVTWTELVGIDFLEPTFFRNGHVHFATAADPRGLTSTGRGNHMAATARNPHAIMFTWQQRRTYRRLRDLLTGSARPTRR
jgi:hypothetical protein